jgi:hypothetical protein
MLSRYLYEITFQYTKLHEAKIKKKSIRIKHDIYIKQAIILLAILN